MDYKCIELKTENHVATVGLNRVDALNAFSYQMATEIIAVFNELNENSDVWVIILKSNARMFSVGLDLKDAMARSGERTAKNMLNTPVHDKNMLECCNALEECKKPIIAAVHNKCVGAGLDTIVACDFRLCTEDASFSLREARVGMVADMGVLQRLPFIVGQMYTRQMAYTGRFFSSAEAEKMGLVLAVYPDQDTMLAAAHKLASEIMESAPLAVQNTKEVLNYSRFVPIKEGMSMAAHKTMLLALSDDCTEAMMAFMEKRPPKFKAS